MVKKEAEIIVPDEIVMNQIYYARGQKVMIDRDLATLYGVETKRLKEAVRRNSFRFPEDFMFEMSKQEFEIWRSQFASSNADKKGLRYAPFCFTESGVTMLSCVLNTERAINVNIQIIRIFTKIRQMLMDNTELRLEIEQIKKKLNNQGKNIELVFQYLDQLLEKNENPKPRQQIGYKKNK
ncbi:MAG: ORF6N domain-containing protein [Bacteroidota bacterium]|nr:ORF6N domain-containing protein [Bacteroidota bacterium]